MEERASGGQATPELSQVSGVGEYGTHGAWSLPIERLRAVRD